MTDPIKSSLTTSFAVFIQEFADPSLINKKELEDKSGFKIDSLFSKQIIADRAKKKLGTSDFNKALAAYFSRHLTSDGLDAEMLGKDLEKHASVLKFHLKKDALRYLKLIAQVGVYANGPKRGLL